MQVTILPDYCDGTKFLEKYDFLLLSAQFAKSLNIKRVDLVDNQYIYDMRLDKDKLYSSIQLVGFKTRMPIELVQENFSNFYELLSSDPTFRSFCVCYNDYIANGEKNYIITKSLTDNLKKTKMTLKGKHLPVGTSGYIEFRDKSFRYKDEDCLGLFFTCHSIDEDNIISGAFVSSIGALMYFNIGCKSENLISDEFNKKCVNDFRGELAHKIELDQTPYDEFVHVVVSTIVFIGNKCEDLIEVKNELSSKPSKREHQIKMFTPKNYILVGEKFHVPKMRHVDGSVVQGHFKWRWVGEGLSELKLLWWNEHERHYKDGK